MAEEAKVDPTGEKGFLEAVDGNLSELLGEEPEAKEPEPEAEEEPETEGEPEAEPDPDQPSLIEYELNGQLYDVPADIHAELEKAGDYTQKTQKVASERKELEVLRGTLESAKREQEFTRSIQDEAGQVQMLDYQVQQANQYLQENFESLDDKEILRLRHQIDIAKGQRDELSGKLQSKYQEYQQAREQSEKELLDKSTAILRSKFKDWSKVEQEISDYALSLGFTEDQVRIAKFDPKQVELVRKAQLYDRLQKGKTAAVEKAKTAPLIKPKARNPMPDNVRRNLDLRKKLKQKSLSDKDKANLIGEDLAAKMGY